MPEPTSLRAAREDTIDDLCRRFAEDELSLPELERRLERARAARSRAELTGLVQDLRPARPPAAGVKARKRPVTAAGSGTSPEAAGDARSAAGSGRPPAPSRTGPGRTSSHLAFAVMGGTRRAGRWVPPANMAAVAIMGGVELDFRHAVLTGDDIEINCFAFWGGVEITVPPDVHVDTRGFALMGGFDQIAELGTDPAPDAPTIRINGLALMGAVEVKVAER